MSSDPMKRSEQNAIRVWMRQVMNDKGWSANSWAVKAGTSPSNITRFLKEGNFTPSSATLSKLAYVAGSQPNFQTSADLIIQQVTKVKLYDNGGNHIRDIGVFGMKGEMSAYLSIFSYEPLGIKPSDTIVVKQDKETRGAFLCKVNGIINQVFESTNDEKLLMCKITGNIVKRKDTEIIGRIVQIVKNLDHPQS